MLANLKTALAARGVRQVDLALSLKMPPSVISEIICERRKASTELRDRIAVALRADADWLFASVTRIPPLRAGFGQAASPHAEQAGAALSCAPAKS